MMRFKRQLAGVFLSFAAVATLVGCECCGPKKPAPAPAPAPRVEMPRPDCKKVVFAYPSGDPRTSIALLEKCMPPEVVAGVSFDFTLTVINQSDSMCLENVVITDKFPTNLKFDSATPAPDAQTDTLRWSIPKMNPREVRVIKAKATATDAGNILQCVAMVCTPTACVEIVATKPSLKLVKQAPAEAMLCDVIPIRLTVTNTGSGVAKDVTIVDNLPAGLTTADGQTAVTQPVGMLLPGQPREVTIMAKASKTGKFDNSATASAAGGLKVESNSTSTVVKQPVLEITKKSLQEKVMVARGAGAFTHEITVTNKGDGIAMGTVVVDTPPAGVAVTKADGAMNVGGRLQFSAGDLRPGESKKFSVSFAAPTAGTYVNNVTASAKCATPVSDKAQTIVAGIPAVLLEMTDDPDPVRVGDIVTYTIVVTNQGSADDTNIAISCELTDEMQFVSCGPKNLPNNQPPGTTDKFTQVPSTQGKADGKSVKFDAVGRLGAKQYVAWEVKVKALKAKDVRFWTTLTTDQTKAGGEIKKNESTTFYE
ncbi:MAG: hypothetical protein ACHRHE_13675 [Tepidisphaerales bacterium]